jgi:TatD DNase family protein
MRKKNVHTTEKNFPKLSGANQLIDTHCHLDMTAYGDDLNQVLERASTNHIKNIITIGIDLASSIDAITIARKYTQVFATIGIHPHDVDNVTDSDYTELERLYKDHAKHIVGYGEIGLDYVKQYSEPGKQREHFSKQLELAHSLKLPVIVHNREADSDTLELLRQGKPLENGGIMHCFSGDYAFARKVLDLGMLISVPGIVTFKNATILQEVAKKIPLSSMVLETDGPFLAPQPFRGKRNEPSYVLYTANKIAEIQGLDIEQVALQTTANAEKIFQLNRL